MPKLLSPNFSLEEMTFSQTAARLGIENVPSQSQIDAMRNLCVAVLQPLRRALGQPIVITSGFRSHAFNRAVNGAVDSQHMRGEAADIICPAMSVDSLFKSVLTERIPFDQLIHEGGSQSAWVHISFGIQNPRHQILAATFPAAGGVIYRSLSDQEAQTLNT